MLFYRAVLVDSSGNVDRTNKTAATVFFKYFFINANSGGLWVQKKIGNFSRSWTFDVFMPFYNIRKIFLAYLGYR